MTLADPTMECRGERSGRKGVSRKQSQPTIVRLQPINLVQEVSPRVVSDKTILILQHQQTRRRLPRLLENLLQTPSWPRTRIQTLQIRRRDGRIPFRALINHHTESQTFPVPRHATKDDPTLPGDLRAPVDDAVVEEAVDVAVQFAVHGGREHDVYEFAFRGVKSGVRSTTHSGGIVTIFILEVLRWRILLRRSPGRRTWRHGCV